VRVSRSIDEAGSVLQGGALAIGNFDGVHLGHLELLRKALERARASGASSGVLTFEPHPAKVLGPGMAPHLLTPLDRKLALIAEAGIDVAVVQPFDAGFARIPARDFVDQLLLAKLGVRDIVVGQDFSFGRDRQGRVEQLGPWLQAGGARLFVVPTVDVEGLGVSSTRIRGLVLEGRMEAAARLLGRPYDLEGAVVPGVGRGRTLGFPTANVVPVNELIPPNGVYAVRVFAPTGVFAGAANLGRKPTFGEGLPFAVEVHLIGYGGGDLVGEQLRVAFLSRLREEMRFPSAAALVAQIGRDVATAGKIASG
jgi:riboflavin kinase / FMN adenylyltransferase